MTKGYVVPCGYMGLVNGNYMLFATETEYFEYMSRMYKAKRREYHNYSYVDYFDVWGGNDEEGWQVNNLGVVEDNICIADDATEKEILEYLSDVRLVVWKPEDMEIDMSDDFMMEISRKEDGRPIGRLSRN